MQNRPPKIQALYLGKFKYIMLEPRSFVSLKSHRFMTIKSQKIKKRIMILLFLFIFFVIPFFAASKGILPIPDPVLAVAEFFMLAIVSLIGVSVLQGLTVNRVFKLLEGEVDMEERIFLTKVYSFFLYCLVLAVVLWKLGVSIGNITIFLGFVATGVAFAIRDIVTSFFVWLIVLTKKPFRIGDTVQIGDDKGTITRIGTIFITMQTTKKSKEFWKVPNKLLLEKTLLNMGKARVLHSKKIALSKIPQNMESRIEKITAIAEKYVEEKESIRALVNTDGEKWYLELSFALHTQEEDKRSKILSEAFVVLKDIIKKSE